MTRKKGWIVCCGSVSDNGHAAAGQEQMANEFPVVVFMRVSSGLIAMGDEP
jgi:hypothetical protein